VTNESILISEVIPATPERIFSAWMDSAEHSAFTGEEATVVPKVGGEHQSAGGYIKGRTLELHEGTRIVQSWRTTEFPPESPDSRVEITLEPTLGGTLVTLLHTDIPVGQGDRYRQGWNEYYLTRLKNYFADGELSAGAAGERSAVVKGADTDDDDFDLDVDVASEVVDIEPTVTAEAPTKVMSQNAIKAKARQAAKTLANGVRAAGPSRTPVKAAATRSAKPAAKPALKAKASKARSAAAKPATTKPTAKKPVKLAAKASSAKKVTRLSMKSAKPKTMKAAKTMKASAKAKAKARKPAKAKKTTAAKAKGKTKASTKASTKKGASSARSGRRR
jgi:uncharacterized protein YndB with AHSA1/START domain